MGGPSVPVKQAWDRFEVARLDGEEPAYGAADHQLQPSFWGSDRIERTAKSLQLPYDPRPQ